MPKRIIRYDEAINESIDQMMSKDKSVFLIGQGVKSPWYVGNTTKNLLEKFGEDRIIDTPVSENATTGAAIGAAIAGMRPIVVHPRLDFMLYAMDPIINEAANWYFMTGGTLNVPVVIWGIINRGGEQGAQHSQAIHALFAHIPGLKVVMPSNAYDAKGLMIAAIKDDNPVLFIDDRWLYNDKGNVPHEIYEVPIGKGLIREKGSDVTIVAVSFMNNLAIQSISILKEENISPEIIDPRTIKPLDLKLISKSVIKTRRLVVIDAAWNYGSIAHTIVSKLMSDINVFNAMKQPPLTITLPNIPAPMSKKLEDAYYLSKEKIAHEIIKWFKKNTN